MQRRKDSSLPMLSEREEVLSGMVAANQIGYQVRRTNALPIS